MHRAPRWCSPRVRSPVSCCNPVSARQAFSIIIATALATATSRTRAPSGQQQDAGQRDARSKVAGRAPPICACVSALQPPASPSTNRQQPDQDWRSRGVGDPSLGTAVAPREIPSRCVIRTTQLRPVAEVPQLIAPGCGVHWATSVGSQPPTLACRSTE